MSFQDRWVRQRPLHVNDGNGRDVTCEHGEGSAIRRPDDLAAATAISHVKELPNYSPIRSLEPDVELRAVEDGDFLTNRDDLAVRGRHPV